MKTISSVVVKPGVSYQFDEYTQEPVVIPFRYKDLIRAEAIDWVKKISECIEKNTQFEDMDAEEAKGAKKALIKFFEIKDEELK